MNTRLRHPLPSTVTALITTLVLGHLHAGEIFAVATSSAIESGCDAAFDGNNYLVGVRGGPFGEGPITAQLISPTGTLVRGDISPGESGGMPHLAFDGANYFMVWAGAEASPGLKGQFVSKAGDLFGSVLNLHPAASLTPTATSVAYGGGKYLTCWSDGTRLLGQLVNPDRTLSGSSFTISGATLEPRENAMVFDGANFFVAFNGGSGNLPNIYGQIVDPQGGLVGGTVLIDDTPDPSDNPLTVSFDGSHYLVAFSDEVGGLGSGTWHLYGKRVSTTGTVLPERLTLAGNPGAQRFPFAAFDGSNYLVAWGDGAEMDTMNLVLRFFSPTGQPVGSEFSPFSQQGAQRPLFGVPLFNGTDYFVTATLVSFTADQEVAGADVYGTFVPKSTETPLPFTYTTNDGTATITGYTGAGGAVIIPDIIDGFPVTRIGDYAFLDTTSLTRVEIPNGVTNIQSGAFSGCSSLVSAALPDSLIGIGFAAFSGCSALTNVSLPDGVASLGKAAFSSCARLTSLRIPQSVTHLGEEVFRGCTGLIEIEVDPANAFYTSVAGVLHNESETTLLQYPCGRAGSYTLSRNVTRLEDFAFSGCVGVTGITLPRGIAWLGEEVFRACTSLTGVYFKGDAPSLGLDAFEGADHATIYYLPETTGWSPTFGDRPTVLWNPQPQTDDADFGVRANRFGFNINGTSDLVVIVEAAVDLENPTWVPVATNTLTSGSSYFSDPEWTKHPARFYRLRSP